MAVMITRLITGEEILGDAQVSADGSECVIKHPTQIGVMQKGQDSRVNIHLSPFCPLAAQDSVVIFMRNVLCLYEPVTEVVNKYNTMFGSGLILPTNSGIATLE